MAVSQANFGVIAGMQLKAWALITSAGVVVRGEGVQTITKAGTGIYSITLTSAMRQAQGLGVVRVADTTAASARAAPQSASAFVVRSFDSAGAPIDTAFHLEVWE